MGVVILILCGHGCGRPLSSERLAHGLRTWRGIACDHCVAERVMNDCADVMKMTGAKRAEFVEKAVAWAVCDDSPHSPPSREK